jgi:hypothetical protein
VPSQIRLNIAIRKYAYRITKLAPSHPVNQAIRSIARDLARDLPDSSEDSDSDSDSYSYSERDSGPPRTQLGRIQHSIQGQVELESLEPIDHFYFAPWNRKLDSIVDICPLPKEEAAQAHNAYLS